MEVVNGILKPAVIALQNAQEKEVRRSLRSNPEPLFQGGNGHFGLVPSGMYLCLDFERAAKAPLSEDFGDALRLLEVAGFATLLNQVPCVIEQSFSGAKAGK